jgi:hypothetical protein
MKKKDFDNLLKSTKEALAIAVGKAPPARVHHVIPKKSAIDSSQPIEISETKPK